MKTITYLIPFLLSITSLMSVNAGEIIMNVESPRHASVFYVGVGTIRGWAISSAGIDRVELFINDKFVSRLPQGGRRADVGDAFPSFPESANSGFAMAFNYAALPTGEEGIASTVGTNVATIRVTDNDGDMRENLIVFGNCRFLTNKFITEEEILNNADLVNLFLTLLS
ncbi:MAG: hypothetical protein R3F37_03500 [Candidatus Competibacteraceae bacterium]